MCSLECGYTLHKLDNIGEPLNYSISILDYGTNSETDVAKMTVQALTAIGAQFNGRIAVSKTTDIGSSPIALVVP